MKCDNCKANYYSGYEYSVDECMLSSESEDIRTDCGCKLHYKTINRLLEEELKGLENSIENLEEELKNLGNIIENFI